MQKLIFVVFDHGSPLVVTAFGANGVGWHSRAALRAVAYLTLFNVVV